MDINLGKNEILAIEGDSRQLAISCHLGDLWLTQQGDPNDHLIEPGQDFTINRKGKVVIVALNPASFKFDSAFREDNKSTAKIGTFFLYDKMNFFKHSLWRGLLG